MADLPRLMPGAEPRFYPGNRTGCLILHGFMASPAEVGWMGDYLSQKYGYTVFVPRLPGHGVNPDDMGRMRWQDWYAAALDAYQVMQSQCEQVYLVGHSMGALLSLLLSTVEKPVAVVCATAPLTAPDKLMPYARLLSPFLRYTDHTTGKSLSQVIHAEQQKRGESLIGRVHYAKWVTRAVYELYTLMQFTRGKLPRVTVPLLILEAANDGTVIAGDAEMIRSQVNSDIVEFHTIQQGGHIMFQDTGREEAFRLTGDFIARLNKTNQG